MTTITIESGRVQSALQSPALMSKGVIHKLRSYGSVLVLRSHVEQLLGYQAGTKAKEPHFESNWAAAVTQDRPPRRR